MKLHAIAVALVGVVVVVASAACPHNEPPARRATVYFRGEPVADVKDVVDGGRVQREEHLLSTGEDIAIVAFLDAHGFAQRARYTRGTLRNVELTPHGNGVTVLMDGSGARVELSKPVVLVDLLKYAQPQRPTDVALVDLATGDVVDGRIERKNAEIEARDEHGGVVARTNVEGVRVGPGAFAEGDSALAVDKALVSPSWPGPVPPRALRLLGVDDVIAAMDLDGPGQHAVGAVVTFDATATPKRAPVDADKDAALFIEKNDAAVESFAHDHATGSALGDAAAIAEAVHALVDASKANDPPSARHMLDHGGDCDGASALVTASLRALGHAARPVSGYKLVDNRYAPHAWVELYTPASSSSSEQGIWVIIDATIPFVGVDATHLKLFDGVGSALTMGRVLGRVRVEPAEIASTSATAGSRASRDADAGAGGEAPPSRPRANTPARCMSGSLCLP